MRLPRLWSALLLCGLAAGCAGSQDPDSGKAGVEKRVERAVALLEERYDSGGPGVAYAVTWRGETMASGGIGYADLEWGVAATDSTVMRIGSLSKSITAIGVLQLVEEGRLDLDAPVSRYAPDLPAHLGGVTMRQLLSHRSGIAEHAFDEALIPYIWQPMTTEQIIETQAGKPVMFPPGTDYEYVNFNYVVVAHVVENITGRSFVDWVNEEIFAANGLRDSHYDENARVIRNRAAFYTEQEGQVVHAAAIDMSHVSAAGALLSSARDMASWAHSLSAGELVATDLLTEAWEPAPLPNGEPTTYGLGFNVGSLGGERLIWHTGLTPGGQGAFGLAPDSEVFFVVLSNGFHLPRTGELMTDVMTILLGRRMSRSGAIRKSGQPADNLR